MRRAYGGDTHGGLHHHHRFFVRSAGRQCGATGRQGSFRFPLTLGGREYLNTTDARGIPNKELYARLRAGEVSKTSAANADVFVAAMEPEMQAGRDVLLHRLFLRPQRHLSGRRQCGPRDDGEVPRPQGLHGRFPLCLFGAGASSSICWRRKKREGMELEALRDYAEDLKLHICHWFTVEDLQFLRRGGRVSAAAAVIGSILSIKPVLHVDNEGRLIPVSKVRGRKASLARHRRKSPGNHARPARPDALYQPRRQRGGCPPRRRDDQGAHGS